MKPPESDPSRPEADDHRSIAHPLHTRHERRFGENRFVYPVLSRRAGGISLGINLNPDKVCNFDCIYCQVDRTRQGTTRFVDLPQLLEEVDTVLPWIATGEIYRCHPFRDTPASLRRLNDLAFSGDGEPTTYRNFDQIVAACADLKRKHGLDTVKMVLITNASMLHRPHVRRALEILDQNQGEIWAKLDAGTESYFRQVERTPIPFQQILANIAEAARTRPIVIQSLFMRIDGSPPSQAEQEVFCRRLVDIVEAGGRIRLVQLYTVARRPAESSVMPLGDDQLDALASRVAETTGLPVATFYGSSEWSS